VLVVLAAERLVFQEHKDWHLHLVLLVLLVAAVVVAVVADLRLLLADLEAVVEINLELAQQETLEDIHQLKVTQVLVV
jgi:hypothetical protein